MHRHTQVVGQYGGLANQPLQRTGSRAAALRTRRPAAERQLVSRTAAVSQVGLGVELPSVGLQLQALAHDIVGQFGARPCSAAQPRWSARHRPWHEVRVGGWRSRGLCGGNVAVPGASARAPQRPTRAASFEGELSGGCRAQRQRLGGATCGPTNQPLQPTGRGTSVPTPRLGRSRPAAEGQLVSWPARCAA